MGGSRLRLLPRWNSILGNISVILAALEELLPEIRRKGPGRPPKHGIRDYMMLLVIKESKKSSLRCTETDWSSLVCGEAVDHSVIHYWEKRLPPELINEVVRIVGSQLERQLGYDFTVIDATAFSDWHSRHRSFHLLNRVSQDTVYPVSIAVDTFDPVPNTRDTIVAGRGLFMGDKCYDVGKVFETAYRHGYTPLIKPQRTRSRGYYRIKGRKVYWKLWRTYRQRGRGESVFGSLTNAFGDRMHTRLPETGYVRSALRVIAYQIKIYARVSYSCQAAIWPMNN